MDQKRPSGFSGTVEIHQEEEQGTTKIQQKHTQKSTRKMKGKQKSFMKKMLWHE